MYLDLIEKQKRGLGAFISAGLLVNVDFAERLGVKNPHEILTDFNCLENFIIVTVHELMKFQAIENEDRIWYISRIGSLLGEYLKQKYSGYWDVDEDENSKEYGHYVIFIDSRIKNVSYPIYVQSAAVDFINQNPGRNLNNLIKRVDLAIKQKFDDQDYELIVGNCKEQYGNIVQENETQIKLINCHFNKHNFNETSPVDLCDSFLLSLN